MYKFCAFDLDGTLVNSVGDIAAAMNYCLRDWGLPEHEKGEYNYFVGNGMKKLCERALPDGKKQLTDELVKKYNLRYSEHCCEMSEPYPGMPQLLKKLIAQGVTVAVVTNKPQNQTDRVIARYYGDIPFAEVLGASSDHLIVNLTNAKGPFAVGDVLRFRPSYGAVLSCFTSEYVGKGYK